MSDTTSVIRSAIHDDDEALALIMTVARGLSDMTDRARSRVEDDFDATEEVKAEHVLLSEAAHALSTAVSDAAWAYLKATDTSGHDQECPSSCYCITASERFGWACDALRGTLYSSDTHDGLVV